MKSSAKRGPSSSDNERGTDTPRRLRALLWGSLGATLITAGLAAPVVAQPNASQNDASHHGAAPTNQQLATVIKMLGPIEPAVRPRGVPAEFWKVLIPADNQPSASRIELGRKLYFDTRLSKDGTLACATCHDVTRGFTDRRATSEGIHEQIGKRNSPTTMNALFFSTQFLDGRAPTLEEQAKLPLVNAIEMGQPDGASVVKNIADDAEYKQMFQAAYGRAPNYDDIGRALAAFQRTLVFLDAPFDRFLAGDADAISPSARAGWALFNGKGRCMSCHQMNNASPIGTDNRFHNIGVAARHQNFEELAKKGLAALAKDASKEAIDDLALQTDLSELGRFVVSRNRSDIGAFKTMQVRNIGVTAPYMHDGSLPTLWDVMDHYNKGGEKNPFLDGGIEPLNLTEAEINQLVDFMFSLTDSRLAEQNRTEEARQRALAMKQRPFRDNAIATRQTLVFERKSTSPGGAQPPGSPPPGTPPSGAPQAPGKEKAQ